VGELRWRKSRSECSCWVGRAAIPKDVNVSGRRGFRLAFIREGSRFGKRIYHLFDDEHLYAQMSGSSSSRLDVRYANYI
jgi:hypothetical protein